jgi:NTP pyrophosphatase (non-canonical NTP hydrolase)
MNLNEFAKSTHQNSRDKGFWDGQDPQDPMVASQKICLMHAELSEMLEAIRKDPHAACEKVPEITCEEEEAADLFLRLLDYCVARRIDLAYVAEKKHQFNVGRPHMHGKKF